MQARFYGPMYHRFLSPDPARDQHFEQTQKWNIYSYVGNHPTLSIDINGMEEYWVIINDKDPRRMATVFVTNKDGVQRTRYEARAMGLARTNHSRTVENGDTPYGEATGGRVMIGKKEMVKNYGSTKAKSYGQAKINLTATDGELLTTGRAAAGVAVHGGGSTLNDPYEAQQNLINTQGCVRMHNADILHEAFEIIMSRAHGDPDVWHIGSAETMKDILPESIKGEEFKDSSGKTYRLPPREVEYLKQQEGN